MTLEAFYKEKRNYVRKFLRAKLKYSEDQIDDYTHEFFIWFAPKLAQFDPNRSQLKTWFVNHLQYFYITFWGTHKNRGKYTASHYRHIFKHNRTHYQRVANGGDIDYKNEMPYEVHLATNDTSLQHLEAYEQVQNLFNSRILTKQHRKFIKALLSHDSHIADASKAIGMSREYGRQLMTRIRRAAKTQARRDV